MKTVIFILGLMQICGSVLCNEQIKSKATNLTDRNKDMYVIHAMVYQLGIITNKTDNITQNETQGNQEALTFYRTNGSKIDLSDIPAPLLTNVTAQSIVQVAPKTVVQASHQNKPQISWADLKGMTDLSHITTNFNPESGNGSNLKIVRRSSFGSRRDKQYYEEASYVNTDNTRYLNSYKDLFKRDLLDKSTVKLVKGAAVIPPSAGVQSIAIPPLLTLNNNLSNIPVPIPNTSVVQYAKINTLIRKP